MRRISIAAFACVAIACGVSARAAEKAPEALVKTMKGLNTAAMDVRTHVGAKDYAALTKTATELQGLLKTNDAFWKQKKAEVGMAQSTIAVKAAADLLAAAKGKDDAGAMAAQKALNGACGVCHTAHRERMPDGTYGLK